MFASLAVYDEFISRGAKCTENLWRILYASSEDRNSIEKRASADARTLAVFG